MDRGRSSTLNDAAMANSMSNRAPTVSQQPIGTPAQQEPIGKSGQQEPTGTRQQEIPTPGGSPQPRMQIQNQLLTEDSMMMPPPPPPCRRVSAILQFQVPAAQLHNLEEQEQQVLHGRQLLARNEFEFEVLPLRLTRPQTLHPVYETGDLSVTPNNIVPPPRHEFHNDSGVLRLPIEGTSDIQWDGFQKEAGALRVPDAQSNDIQQHSFQNDRETFRNEMDEVNTMEMTGLQQQMDEVNTARDLGFQLGTTEELAYQQDESNIHPSLRNLKTNTEIVPAPLFAQHQVQSILRNCERQCKNENLQAPEVKSETSSPGKDVKTSSSVLVEAYNRARDNSTDHVGAGIQNRKVKLAFALAWISDCASQGCVGFVVGGRDQGPAIWKMRITKRSGKDNKDPGREE